MRGREGNRVWIITAYVSRFSRLIFLPLYVGAWELLYNSNFNSVEFDGFKNEVGTYAHHL